MTNDQYKFIDTIGVAAMAYYSTYQILPSLVVAMAIKESAFGKSQLAAKHYNYFGMKWNSKCGCKWVEYNTKEWDKAKQAYITVKAKFRSYSSPEEGIKGFYDFISSYKRYQNLVGETDPAEACVKIQADGWATSPTYATSLYKDYILKYSLTRFDISNGVQPEPVPDTKPYFMCGKVYTTLVNLYIRKYPNGTKKKPYELTVNGKINSFMDNQGNAVLKEGTRVTCKEILQDGEQIWLLIPSGYICAYNGEKYYVK